MFSNKYIYLVLVSYFAIPYILFAMPASQATNWTSKAIGEMGEAFMTEFYRLEGWEKLPLREANPLNGLDGVFVKRRNGIITEFMPVESKTNTSQLSTTKSGAKQGHTKYVLEKLDTAENYYSKLNDKAKLKDIKQLKRLTNVGAIKPRLFHTNISGNRIITTITTLSDGITSSDVLKGSPKEVLNFQLNAPKNNFEIRAQKAFFRGLEDHLTKTRGISSSSYKHIVNDLLKGSNICNSIQKHLHNYKFKVPSELSIPGTSLVNPKPSTAYKGNNIKITQGRLTQLITKTGKRLGVLQVKFPIGSIIRSTVGTATGKSILSGIGAGIGTFIIGEGIALYRYSEGSISNAELEQQTIKYAGEAVVVSTAVTIVTAACSTNPAGWVIIGVGITASAIYEICYDFTIPTKITEEDLLTLLPSDLHEKLCPIKEDDKFMYSTTSDELFGINENPSILDVDNGEKLYINRKSKLEIQ